MVDNKNNLTKQSNNKLTEQEYREFFKISKKLCNKFKHFYSVPEDLVDSYVIDILSFKYLDIKNLLVNSEYKSLYKYLHKELMSSNYLNIQKVVTKDRNKYKYNIFCNVKPTQSISKYDIKYFIDSSLSQIFNIEYSKIKDLREDGVQDEIYKVTLYGKPTEFYLDKEDLEFEVEKLINNITELKVLSIDTKINNRFYVSLYKNFELVDIPESCLEITDSKVLFYSYIEEFNLTKQEEDFINLIFKGYHPFDDEDIKVFQQVIKKPNQESFSVHHLRNGFFNKLVKKLKENSPFRD